MIEVRLQPARIDVRRRRGWWFTGGTRAGESTRS